MAENFVNILREIRGNTLAPATDRDCIYGDIKWMYGVIEGYQQITPEERFKLKNIEEKATKNSTDAFLLSRANHTGTMSMEYTTDSSNRFAMSIDDKNKLDGMISDATKNDTDANLRNRATHRGTQSIDTITDTSTHVKMSVAERSKLSTIATGSTKNATDAELRNRSTHTGVQSIDTVVDSPTHAKMTIAERNKLTAIQPNATKNAADSELRNRSTHTGVQSADTIVNGTINAAFTNVEKIKLAALDTTKPPAHFHDNETISSLSYSKLVNVPSSFTPSVHSHNMSEITLGKLDASRINESSDKQFVTSIERDKISGSEQVVNRGVPNGYVPLDGNGKINPSYIDSMNLIDVFTPVDFDEMLLLSSAMPGDMAYVQSLEDMYILIASPYSDQSNWKKLNLAAGVISVNGSTGIVSLSSDDLPEGTFNKYFTADRVTNEVKNLIQAGTNVTVNYDLMTNKLTIDADTYAKTEIDAKLEAQNDASEINYSGTSSGLVATKVQGAIDEVENRLGAVETSISSVNLIRADRYLASQNIAKMIYDLEGNLLKVRYNNDVDVDYEVLTYSGENLVNLAHYVNGELKGNTVMTYASDELVSSIFIGV